MILYPVSSQSNLLGRSGSGSASGEDIGEQGLETPSTRSLAAAAASFPNSMRSPNSLNTLSNTSSISSSSSTSSASYSNSQNTLSETVELDQLSCTNNLKEAATIQPPAANPLLLKRQFSLFHSFGLSFSVLSAMASITPLLSAVMAAGGPAVMIWGWFLVSIMMCFLALAMAELCAAYPVSAGLYYWSAVLGGRRYGPFFAWITAWFNIMGWIALTASFNYACVDALWEILPIRQLFNVRQERQAIRLALFFGLHLLHILINTRGHKLLPKLNHANVCWQILGTAVIVVTISIASASTPPPANPLTKFIDRTGLKDTLISSASSSSNLSSSLASSISAVYAAAIGLLQAQYTYTGLDAAVHSCGEMLNASKGGPIGIIMSVGVASIVGLTYILGLAFAIQDYPVKDGASGLFNSALGSEVGGNCLMGIVMVAMFFAGLFAITTTSRILYTFAGDGGLPRSPYWHTLSPHTHMPTRTIWLTAAIAFLITTPSLFSITAFTAVTSIATIGLFISYAIPIVLRHTLARSWFWNPSLYTASFLGQRASKVVGWISIMWVGFVSILFILPTRFPVSIDNFNFAAVMVVIAMGGSLGSWWFGGVKVWFKGPRQCNL